MLTHHIEKVQQKKTGKDGKKAALARKIDQPSHYHYIKMIEKARCVCRCVWLTTRHDVAYILHGEGRVLVFCVDPDDAMAEPSHGEDGPGRQGGSTCPRSGKHREEP